MPRSPASARARASLTSCANRGQAFELAVERDDPDEPGDPDALREAFAAVHEQRYGYREDAAGVELVNVRAVGLGPGAAAWPPRANRRLDRRARPRRAADRAERPRARRLDAVRRARLVRRRRRARHDRARRQRMSALDPIELQVVAGALRAACEEMGVALVRAAHSSNIKERRDCSTALFDAGGEMVIQAEHIPVHLGSMPAAVAAVRDERHAPGVSWVLNDPFAGGTPPPRHHRRHARVRRPRADRPRKPAAPTTQTSAGARPDRCPPTATRSPTRAS